MKMKQIMLTSLLTFMFIPSAGAQSSEQYAVMARAVWSAFECSSLAAESGDHKEQKRLFMFGYNQGKVFIAAVQAGKVKRKDLSSNAPIGVLVRLEGPSPDFMLGRIYEGAQDDALNDVYHVGNSDKDNKLAASNKFTTKNCQLIGSGR